MTVARGLYTTTNDPIPISVDSTGRVQVSSSSGAVTYVATPATGELNTKSLDSAALHYCATPAAASLNTKSVTSAALHYCATPAAASLNTKSVTSAGLHYVSTPAAGQLSVKSLTSTGLVYCATPAAGHVHVASFASSELVYTATPASAGLTTKPRFKLTTASFTSGARIAGTATIASTTITAGTYRVAATGNAFYLRIGATTVSLTTKAFVMSEGTSEVLYLGGTKLLSICAAAAGALYLTKMS